MLTLLSLPQRVFPLPGLENSHGLEPILYIVVVARAFVSMAQIRVKMATGPPSAERSGREGEDVEGMGQVEGFGNGKVDITTRVILRCSTAELSRM